MSKISKTLYVIGVLAIVGGIVIGFTSYDVVVGYEEDVFGIGTDPVTEKNVSVLFTWIGAGLISGVMMFGFAEIVNQLVKQTEYQKKMYDEMTKEEGKRKYLLDFKDN